jgi:hypothetical protein
VEAFYGDQRKLRPRRQIHARRVRQTPCATVFALDGIDVELRHFIEAGKAIIVGRAFLGMDAIYGAGIDAGGVVHPDAGLGNDVSHRPPRYSSQREDSSDAGRKLLRVEKISAVAFWVANMKASVQFYQDLLGTGGAGLRGAAKVCVYADPPLIKQPFWDVESVSVPFAPIAELRRENIGPWRQV